MEAGDEMWEFLLRKDRFFLSNGKDITIFPEGHLHDNYPTVITDGKSPGGAFQKQKRRDQGSFPYGPCGSAKRMLIKSSGDLDPSNPAILTPTAANQMSLKQG